MNTRILCYYFATLFICSVVWWRRNKLVYAVRFQVNRECYNASMKALDSLKRLPEDEKNEGFDKLAATDFWAPYHRLGTYDRMFWDLRKWSYAQFTKGIR